MAFQGGAFFSRRHVPDTHHLVIPPGEETVAVGQPGQRSHGLRVSLKLGLRGEPFLARVKHADGKSPAPEIAGIKEMPSVGGERHRSDSLAVQPALDPFVGRLVVVEFLPRLAVPYPHVETPLCLHRGWHLAYPHESLIR